MPAAPWSRLIFAISPGSPLRNWGTQAICKPQERDGYLWLLWPLFAALRGCLSYWVASASLIGSWLAAYADQLAPLAGLVVIAFGLHALNLLRLPSLLREARLALDRLFGLLGAFAVGTAFALSWTPCVGPMLATILLIAGSHDSAGKGVLLAVYAAGLAISFLATALAMRRAFAALARLRPSLPWAQKLTGALLVLTGISFMTGAIHQLGFWPVALFPALSRIG